MKNTHLHLFKGLFLQLFILSSLSLTFLPKSYAQEDYCSAYNLTSNNGGINLSNLNAPIEIIDIYDANWQLIFNCRGTDCGQEVTLPNLSADIYHINMQFYTEHWEYVCREQIDVTVTDDDGNGNGGNGGGTTFDCDEITITISGNSVEMRGESGSSYFFKIHDLNNNWQEAFSCAYNCGDSQTANDLADGNYIVRVYNSSWSIICEQPIDLTGGNGGSTGGSDCPAIPAMPADDNYEVSAIDNANKTVTVSQQDASGNIIQTNTYQLGFSNILNQDLSSDVKVFEDHLIVAVSGIFDNGTFKYLLLKIDLNGTLIWQQLNDFDNGSNESITIESQGQNGGYYLQFKGQGRHVLAGTDNVGNHLWQQNITPIVFDKYFIQFIGEVSDGSAFYVNVYEDNFIFTLEKRNTSDGELIWEQVMNLPGEQFLPRPFTVITPDDGVIARYTWRFRTSNFDAIDGFNYRKLDTNGEIVWNQDLPQDIFSFDNTPDLLEIENGFYLNAIGASGENDLYTINADGTLSACGTSTSTPPMGSCGEITITTTGNSINMQGQSGNAYFFKVHDLNNNWAEVFGCAYNCGDSQTASDLENGNYMVRVYDDSWNLICDQGVDLGAESRNRESSLKTFTVYPNPAQEELFIDLQEFDAAEVQIAIANLYGQVVYQQKIESLANHTVAISLDNFSNGIYLVNLRAGNRIIKSEKLLVQRLY